MFRGGGQLISSRAFLKVTKRERLRVILLNFFFLFFLIQKVHATRGLLYSKKKNFFFGVDCTLRERYTIFNKKKKKKIPSFY